MSRTIYRGCAFVNYSITVRTLFLPRTKLSSPKHKKYHQLICASLSYTLLPFTFSPGSVETEERSVNLQRKKELDSRHTETCQTQCTHPSMLNSNSYRLHTQAGAFTFVSSLFMVKIISSPSSQGQKDSMALTSKIKLQEHKLLKKHKLWIQTL